MSESESQSNLDALPPSARLIQMGMGHFVSRLLYVAAKLNLADHLGGGPKSAEELAALTGTHAPSLHRAMRTLASLGLLTERADQRFGLTEFGEALKTNAPGSARATILTFAGDWAWQLPYSVQTGKCASERALGMPLFEWLAKNPEQALLFNESMAGFHGAEPTAVAAAYDFSGAKTIVDVGGGTGNLLTTILASFPGPRGVLFDVAHVARNALGLIRARGLESRVKITPGSFFESVPSGGDVYLLSHIIHDWNWDQSVTILRNCRRAMTPEGRLLLIEMVLPSGDTPHPGKILDMVMLAATEGQERGESEYRALLEATGFRLAKVVPTASATSVVEAVPV